MSASQDKRAADRFLVSESSACVFASPVLEDFGPVRIVNISMHGIGLSTTEPLQTGLLLAVRLVNPGNKFDRTMLVRVIYILPQAGGAYIVGGKFETPLTYEEMCALVM